MLLMDQYGSHMTNIFTEYAKNNNINILYIPVGLTSKYQPLDVGVNGILKNKAINAYTNYIIDNPNKTYTPTKCVEDFLIYKKEIKKSTIIHSFDCLKNIKKE